MATSKQLVRFNQSVAKSPPMLAENRYIPPFRHWWRHHERGRGQWSATAGMRTRITVIPLSLSARASIRLYSGQHHAPVNVRVHRLPSPSFPPPPCPNKTTGVKRLMGVSAQRINLQKFHPPQTWTTIGYIYHRVAHHCAVQQQTTCDR